jgi:hypothetical protein
VTWFVGSGVRGVVGLWGCGVGCSWGRELSHYHIIKKYYAPPG